MRKNTYLKKRNFLLAMASSLLLWSCSYSHLPTSPDATQTITLTATKTGELLTEPSATIAPLSTRIPLSTLNSTDARNKVQDLIENNGGCNFPCFWGIIPGQTLWDDAQYLFEPFAIEINPSNDINHRYSYYVRVPTPNNSIIIGFHVDNGGVVDLIATAGFWSLADILNTYGEPEEIWFESNGVGLDGSTFSLALYYSKGFVMIYDGVGNLEKENDESSVVICKNHLDALQPLAYFWSPKSYQAFEEIKSFVFPDPTVMKYRELSGVTNIDVATFTKIFSAPESKGCFKSSVLNWVIIPTIESTP